MNSKHAILPIVAILFYISTATGMILLEGQATTNVRGYIFFLKSLETAKDKEERTQIANLFTQTMKENPLPELRNFFEASQKTIDSITPGMNHCATQEDPCGFYTNDLLNEFFEMKAVLETMVQVQVGKISTTDNAIKTLTLAIEALAVSLLIQYAYTALRKKRKKWK